MHVQKAYQWLGLGVIAVLFCLPVFSQTSQGTIQGGVFDQSGGAIAGATVSVVDVARGVTRALTTDSAGEYIANDVTPGTYTVKAEAKGFQTVEHSGVLVEVGQNIRVDLVVQPGEQTQTITVTEEVPAVDTTDATLGGTVSNLAINALPLNGRNFERLLELRPGTIALVGAGTGTESTNGRQADRDILRVEGIAGIADSVGSSLLNASYKGGDASNLVPIDAIQEFSTEQDPKAEYGFRDGAVINLGIKSGTNSLHGTAYAFGRDGSATDAANFFTNAVTPATLEQFGATAGGPILKDKLFWFASYEGLRIAVGDVTETTIPSSVAMTAAADPSSELSMVDACNFLNAKHLSINGLSAQLAGLNPTTCVVTPASPSFENVFPYLNSATSNNFAPGLPTTLPLNNGLFKADYNLGSHHHLDGMYFVSKSQNLMAGSAILAQWGTIAINDAQQYDGDWTWTPNSTWVNDVRLGYVYINNQDQTPDQNMLPSNPWPSGYGMNTGVTNPLYGGFPEITFSSFKGVLGEGGSGRVGRRGPEGDVDLVESVSYLHGKHAFKYGFEFLDMIKDGYSLPGVQGIAAFTTLQNFLQGIPNSGSIYLGDPTEYAQSHWYGVFFQDDWRIKPRVTLNLGLRYEYYTSPVERDNYLGDFNPNVNPATTPAVEQVGPGKPLSSEFKSQGRFAPRLGVAWDVRGDGKTVIRAGVGVMASPSAMATLVTTTPFGANFPSIGVNNSGTAANLHTPARFTLGACATSFCAGQWNWNLTGVPVFPTAGTTVFNGATYTGVTCLPATPCQTGGLDPNYREPYVAEWNFDIQRAITNKVTLDVAYVGNHGFQQAAMTDLNQPPLGTGWPAPVASPANNTYTCMTTSVCKPNTAAELAAGQYSATFPYLSQIDEVTNGNFSNYDALQATLQARGYHGLSFLAGYAFAHALSVLDDTDPNDSGSGSSTMPTDKNNLRLNYGSSAYDIRHRFTFSPSYAIPGMKSPGQMLEGWSLNALITVQTGLPWNPIDATSTDWLGTGEKNNGSIGTGVTQYWNYAGPRSAFSNTGPNPIPCYGSLGGCTPFASAPAAIQTACQNAATAPYGGATTTDGQLALAALANAACYMQDGGILTPPAYGTVGNASRGIFTGPNYTNVDFSVAKIWKFKERYSAQFRTEFFNLFNHADFAAPGIDPSKGSSGGFGYSSTTPDSANAVLGSGGPRHIQFGLKLIF
jgi:hypothetical protein